MLLSVLVGLPLSLCSLLYLHVESHRDDWKETTSPLPSETVKILCRNFNVENDPICDKEKEIYAPDFYPIIRDAFKPYESYSVDSSESATYDEVEEKIGMFKYECEAVVYQADGFVYFRCRYDLRGDRALRITITFTYPEKDVFRINTPLGNDD